MAAEWTKAADERTGREVWQITAGRAASHFCYQTAQGFTADERYVLFSSDRTGPWQLYRADLLTGEVDRISDVADYHHDSFSMHSNGREMLFTGGERLFRADVASGEIVDVIDLGGQLPGSWRGHAMPVSADGRRTVLSWHDGGDRYGLAVVHLADRRVEIVLDAPTGPLLHPQFCPGQAELICFCWFPDTQDDMSLPMEQRARNWVIDTHTRETRPFLMCPYGSRGTHEYWNADGTRLYFHRKTEPGWVPTSLCSIDREGGDWQTHYTHETLKLGHSDITADERWIVTDVQEPDENPLLLVDVPAAAAEVLCWPNSSLTGGHAKQAHVHPSFSPRGGFVGFTSDRTGRPQVYVVPLRGDGPD